MNKTQLKKEIILEHILVSITENRFDRVYFEDYTRSPVYGKFVMLGDHEECLKKGMVRFVSESKRELFERNSHFAYTRLMTINTIKSLESF